MKLLQYQFWHILALSVLLYGLYWLTYYDNSFLEGTLLGVDTKWWMVAAVLSPILHQVYVLVVWRIELYHRGFTKLFGAKAFRYYKKGFTVLILSRIITLTLLAIANRNSLEMSATGMYGFILMCIVPAVYLFYSVVKYFGMDRAYGLDHFKPEEAREWAKVTKGVFKYTNNGMYVFGFFALYVPGLIFASKAALLVALFNHIYIWVHFYTTELPDMREIYGE